MMDKCSHELAEELFIKKCVYTLPLDVRRECFIVGKSGNAKIITFQPANYSYAFGLRVGTVDNRIEIKTYTTDENFIKNGDFTRFAPLDCTTRSFRGIHAVRNAADFMNTYFLSLHLIHHPKTKSLEKT